MKPLFQTKPEHVERDKKYKAFVRDDLESIQNPINRPLMYVMAPTVLPRYTLCWFSWIIMALIS